VARGQLADGDARGVRPFNLILSFICSRTGDEQMGGHGTVKRGLQTRVVSGGDGSDPSASGLVRSGESARDRRWEIGSGRDAERKGT
jgi:hypothetical protein